MFSRSVWPEYALIAALLLLLMAIGGWADG